MPSAHFVSEFHNNTDRLGFEGVPSFICLYRVHGDCSAVPYSSPRALAQPARSSFLVAS